MDDSKRILREGKWPERNGGTQKGPLAVTRPRSPMRQVRKRGTKGADAQNAPEGREMDKKDAGEDRL